MGFIENSIKAYLEVKEHEEKKKDSLNINQAGVDTAKKFNWENSAKKILEAIERND